MFNFLNKKRILQITPDWKTPATDYPLTIKGIAELVRIQYIPGLYSLNHIDGYNQYEVKQTIPVTCLKINNIYWMVDDPYHWIGMQRLAEHSFGRVIVGGLGLGLIVHALALNEKVTSIVVYDNCKDVIDLISGFIPKTEIRNDDVFTSNYSDFDTVILDVWNDPTDDEIEKQNTTIHMYDKINDARKTGIKVLAWNPHSPAINPGTRCKCSDPFK
jgi:hypothetical protein